MKKQLRKIISFILVCYIVLLSLTVSSFASDSLLNSDMSRSPWSWLPISDFIPTISYDSSTDENTFTLGSNRSGYGAIRSATISGSEIVLSHTYRVKFKYKGYFGTCPSNVYFYVKVDANNLKIIPIAVIDNSNYTSSYGEINVQINLTDYELTSIVNAQFQIDFQPTNNSNHIIYIKDFSLVDVDDNSGFWTDLWSKLLEIKNSISNGVASIISGINSKLSTFQTAVQNAINGIQTWFVNLGNDISGFFTMLKNYLLYFHHPVTLNQDGVPLDEYGEPLYENIFDIPDFFETLEDWVDDLDEAKTNVETGANSGINAIQNTLAPFSTLITSISFLSVFLTFALAIIVIKKVIG